ncbi:hypothetical protein [Virgisporangium aurantiacum]|uniref:Uncharacterized protein n=1 Tax=Virgisporangium aurantiacum TaxID=175570 RepID=A0A8J3ZDK1_9ACTN|nr:hypothetical protein [Virgisporangium aurantiacum]GIJ62009.1 hypothetical protein Vau01_095250 [Virgisporangium aurantiacum]
MSIVAIVGAVTAAKEFVQGIETVGKFLDGARSCVITVKNRTDQRLEIVSEGHDSGGYAVPPDQYVEANTFQVFGHQDNGFMTGSIGNILYRVGPQVQFDERFYIRWANPFIGPNAVATSTYRLAEMPPPLPELPPLLTAVTSDVYEAFARGGSGEVAAQMNFELYRRE